MDSVEEIPKRKINAKLVVALKERGLTLHEISRQMNVASCTLSRLMNGHAIPRPSTAKKICDYLDLKVEDVFKELWE